MVLFTVSHLSSYFWGVLIIYFNFMYVGVLKESDPLEQELKPAVSQHVVARNSPLEEQLVILTSEQRLYYVVLPDLEYTMEIIFVDFKFVEILPASASFVLVLQACAKIY